MATSLGKIAKAEIVNVSTQLHFGTTAQTNTLPVAGADKVTLNDSGNNDRRIELLDNTDTPAFAVWQRGTLYTKDTIRARGLIKFLTTPKKHPGAAVTTSNDIGEKAK